MRQLKITATAAALLLCSVASLAATPADFYVELLQKGITQYNAADYREAANLLRVAAFGLLDATDRYEVAQVYRAIAADKLSDVATTRDAARRLLAAERIQRSYASLALPAAVRTSFESVAKKVLAPAEMALLKSAPPSTPTPAPAPQTATPPATTTTQPAVETKPAPQQAPPQKTEQVTQSPSRPVAPGNRESGKTVEQKKPVEKKPAEKPPTTPPPPRDPASQFTSAEKALAGANLNEARRIYKQLLDTPLTHEQALRVAEGLYRARDFANVIRAFDRAGTLKRGEEPYRFYLAVALYESGRFAAAKKELDATLPFIEITPDVARYRDKINANP